MSKPGFITIVDINERFGVKLTTGFIVETLGVEPDEQDKRSLLWREERFRPICNAFSDHIVRCAEVEYDEL